MWVCQPTMAFTSSVKAASSSAWTTSGGSTVRSARPPFTAWSSTRRGQSCAVPVSARTQGAVRLRDP
ncbi:hypothetical protein D7Y04_29520 [Corallococcus sp. AB038B]|nr:hypothetical protein D7Y04_29520 [Corallococcus sp. AB038B]